MYIHIILYVYIYIIPIVCRSTIVDVVDTVE